LKKSEYAHIPNGKHLWSEEVEILNEIIAYPNINKIELSQKTGQTLEVVTKIIKKLINRGYIIKSDRKKETPWTILQTYERRASKTK